MTDDRTTLKSTLAPDRDHLHVEASNPVPGSIFLELDGRWCTTHVDANELRAAIDKAVGPADSPEPQPVKITDEMVERGARVLADWDGAGGWGTPRWGGEIPESAYIHGARKALTAALTEPPARPEGAEEIERVLREEWSFSDEDGGEEAFADLAGRLAQRGVRAVGEERS